MIVRNMHVEHIMICEPITRKNLEDMEKIVEKAGLCVPLQHLCLYSIVTFAAPVNGLSHHNHEIKCLFAGKSEEIR